MGLRETLLIVVCSLIMAMIGYATIVMGVVAPVLIKETDILAAELGPVFSAVALGGAVGAVAAALIDRMLGKKFGLALSLVLMAIGLWLSTLASSAAQLVAFRALTGFGAGLATPIVMAVAGAVARPDHAARISSIVAAGAPAGTFLTGLVGGFVLERFGWRPLFTTGGFLCLLIAVMLVWVYSRELAGSPERSGTAQQDGRAGVKALFAESKVTTLVVVAVSLLSSIAMYVIGSWLPVVLTDRGVTIMDSSLSLALFTVGGSIGALVVGRFMDSANPYLGVAAGYAIGALGVAALAFDTSRLFMLAATLFAGILAYGAHMSLFSLVNVVYPKRFRLVALSGLVVIFRVGGFLGPLIAGFALLAGLPLAYLMVATAVLLVGTGGIMGLFTIYTRAVTSG